MFTNRKIIFILFLIFIISISILFYRGDEGMDQDVIPPISIIYFAYLKKERWPHIVLPQMEGLLKNELLQNSVDLHICLSGEKEDILEAEEKIKVVLEPYLQKIHFHHTYENLFEYPGIKKLYDQAIQNPENIFLYFHSKGMVFHECNSDRNFDELALFKSVIDAWKEAINKFKNEEINKVTFGCSEDGVGYYNFFWIRGKYLQRCDSPEITENRYYYESYIGKCLDKTHNECHSLVSNDSTHFSNSEIVAEMAKKHDEMNKNRNGFTNYGDVFSGSLVSGTFQ